MFPTKRRILEKIEIDEISGVDRPCVEHARVAIMKRAQEPKMNSFAALEDSVLILKDKVDVLNQNLAARVERAPPDFDAVAATIQRRDGCAGTEAFTKARREAPTAFAAYNGPNGVRPNANAIGKASATADFMREVEALVANGSSKTAAMSEVRRREPELFRQFQEV